MAYVKNRFTSWSFSRLHDWEGCAFFAKLKHLDKLPVPGSPAMDRGAAIGKMCEDYVSGILPEVPEELEHFGPEFMELRTAYRKGKGKTVWIEEMWGFDVHWQPVHWKDWDNCVLRVKMDLARLLEPDHLLNVDYKTGKFRAEMAAFDYVPQLRLYATAAFSRFPEIQKVSASLAYLDLGITYPAESEGPLTFTRDQAEGLRKEWDKRAAPMLSDAQFRPNPGNACRWCHFKKSNGGPCQY